MSGHSSNDRSDNNDDLAQRLRKLAEIYLFIQLFVAKIFHLASALPDKHSVVHREQIDAAVSSDDLDLLTFIVAPLFDFKLLCRAIRPFGDGIVVCVVCVEHVEIATSREQADKSDCCNSC